MQKRIVSRPDFDGVVCAVLLKRALGEVVPVVWAQPSEIQHGAFAVHPDDVVANLPLSGDVALWFDHHVSNTTDIPYRGLFRIAPSAARLVYEYFRDKMEPHHLELVRQADKIDAAQLTLEEIRHPEHHPFILLSMTISGASSDQPYCDLLVELLGSGTLDRLLVDPTVRRRMDQTIIANEIYESYLKRFTRLQGHIAITDFRPLPPPVPEGNRFLVYSLFAEACVNIKLYIEGSKTVIKLGHSILNRSCRVNVGKLLSRYNGGGHRGAGACRVESTQAGAVIDEIIDTLACNQPDEETFMETQK